jgi:predicted NUDIX family NTP pyrophosphohydrolase
MTLVATSAGLLLHRRRGQRVEVLLVHPGGPFWARRDDGAWSIPKGEVEEGEELDGVAEREFREELGQDPPPGPRRPLGSVRQSGGKVVHAWALEGDVHVDLSRLTSNTFEMEWPPRSGQRRHFPEVDRAAWFELDAARIKLVRAQAEFVDRLGALLGDQPPAIGAT